MKSKQSIIVGANPVFKTEKEYQEWLDSVKQYIIELNKAYENTKISSIRFK